MTTSNMYPIPSYYLEPGSVPFLSKAHSTLQSWSKNWDLRTNALIIGPSDSGKTTTLAHTVSGIRAWDIRNKVNGLVISRSQPENSTPRDELDVVRWIRADKLSWMANDKAMASEVTLLEKCKVLVIDEMGCERFPELLLSVIGTRFDWHRTTLATSGEPFDVFAKRYGDATVKRLTRSGGATLVDCWQPEPKRSNAQRQAVAPPVTRLDALPAVTGPGPAETRQTANPAALKAIREKLNRLGGGK
jgi:hypothetical protein